MTTRRRRLPETREDLKSRVWALEKRAMTDGARHVDNPGGWTELLRPVETGKSH